MTTQYFYHVAMGDYGGPYNSNEIDQLAAPLIDLWANGFNWQGQQIETQTPIDKNDLDKGMFEEYMIETSCHLAQTANTLQPFICAALKHVNGIDLIDEGKPIYRTSNSIGLVWMVITYLASNELDAIKLIGQYS